MQNYLLEKTNRPFSKYKKKNNLFSYQIPLIFVIGLIGLGGLSKNVKSRISQIRGIAQEHFWETILYAIQYRPQKIATNTLLEY